MNSGHLRDNLALATLNRQKILGVNEQIHSFHISSFGSMSSRLYTLQTTRTKSGLRNDVQILIQLDRLISKPPILTSFSRVGVLICYSRENQPGKLKKQALGKLTFFNIFVYDSWTFHGKLGFDFASVRVASPLFLASEKKIHQNIFMFGPSSLFYART